MLYNINIYEVAMMMQLQLHAVHILYTVYVQDRCTVLNLYSIIMMQWQSVFASWFDIGSSISYYGLGKESVKC